MAFSFLRILTYILGLVGTSLLLPLGVALWKRETAMVPAFLVPMLAPQRQGSLSPGFRLPQQSEIS